MRKLISVCLNFRILRSFVLAVGLVGVTGTVAFAQSFQLSGVRFNDSAYLDDAALQGAVAPYLNRPIVFDDVSRMIGAVEQLYRSEGVVTASVVLQPQEVNDGGVLRLTLIEAVTENVAYDARTSYQEDLLANVFPPVLQAFPDYDEITNQIRFFQIAYGVLPAVSFAPGQAPATAVQTIGLEVAPRADWRLDYDNAASEGEDRNRLTLTRSYFDFSGRLDSLSASASITAGGFKISGDYRLPVGPYGGKVGGTATYSQSEIVAGPFAATQLETQAAEVAAFYAQPFWITDDRLFQFQIGINASNTQSTISGVSLQDTTLADIDGRVTMAQSYEKAALSVEAGLRIGNASSQEASASDGGFVLGFANGAYDRVLTDRFAFRVVARAQLAPDQNLPSGQRFSGGGVGSLVGYPDDVRTGDSGITGRLQLTCSAPCFSGSTDIYRPEIYAFADAGYIQTFRGDDASVDEEDPLYSIGMGGSFEIGQAAFTASVGLPLAETTGFDDINSPRFYVAMSYNF